MKPLGVAECCIAGVIISVYAAVAILITIADGCSVHGMIGDLMDRAGNAAAIYGKAACVLAGGTADGFLVEYFADTPVINCFSRYGVRRNIDAAV